MIKTAQKNTIYNIAFWAVFLCLAFTLSGCKDKAEKEGAVKLYPLQITHTQSPEQPPIEFMVERAVTPEEQEVGLMNRALMADGHGMIFVYAVPARPYFWMKNTLIPLDMLFINFDGVIVNIHKNAQPHDLTPIDSGSAVRAVLEINAGLSDKYGIQLGDKIVFNDYK